MYSNFANYINVFYLHKILYLYSRMTSNHSVLFCDLSVTAQIKLKTYECRVNITINILPVCYALISFYQLGRNIILTN